MTFIDVQDLSHILGCGIQCVSVSKSQYLQFASVNQRLLETKIPFVSIEKLFSEPKIGSNQQVLLFLCVASGSTLHFVCNTTVIVFHILPFTTTKHQSARK
jgi:hypothetical protein